MSELLKNIAVVIDADNTQLPRLPKVLEAVAQRGHITLRRAYGDWQKEALKHWEQGCSRLAIRAVQQFGYVAGKNASDMALIIDTMDLLHRGLYDGFVIVSSDSDYTPLALRLRESGAAVVGVGEKKTPESFRNACNEFLFLEDMAEAPVKKKVVRVRTPSQPPKAQPRPQKSQGKPVNDLNELHNLLKKAHEKYQDAAGFASVGPVGHYLKQAKPDFDCRTYGFKKLSLLLKAFPKRYEVRETQGKNNTSFTYRCLKK